MTNLNRFFWVVEVVLLLAAVIVLSISSYHPNTVRHRQYFDIGLLAIAFSILVRRIEEGWKH
jgi:hypothetical protein